MSQENKTDNNSIYKHLMDWINLHIKDNNTLDENEWTVVDGVGKFKNLTLTHTDNDAQSANELTFNLKYDEFKDENELVSCQSGTDGECNHLKCSQLKDGEPKKTGRFCPLPHWSDNRE